MGASTTARPASPGKYNNRVFWERQWRGSGIIFVVLFIVSYALYGLQPGVGGPADALAAFYDGQRTRILIAAAVAGQNILNLLWFVAALRTTLADAGEDGWGAAATASSAVLAGLYLLFVTAGGALAFSIAGSGNQTLTAGLNDFAWACAVVTSFPRAMLIMAGSFGFWRAGVISNRLFGAGVAAVVLVLLGGFTWMRDGFWAPDGAFTRFVSPAICLVWLVVFGRVVARSPATRAAW